MGANFDRALLSVAQGRYDLAVQEARAELTNEPDNPQVHAFLAGCLAQLGRTEEAIDCADEAARLSPEEAVVHYGRAHVLALCLRFAEAEAAIREALRLEPECAHFWAYLALILGHQQRWTEAVQASEHGLRIDPHDPSCLNAQAMALSQLGRGQQAFAISNAALGVLPEDAANHATQALVLLHRRRPPFLSKKADIDAAQQHLNEALRINPMSRWAQTVYLLAKCARLKGGVLRAGIFAAILLLAGGLLSGAFNPRFWPWWGAGAMLALPIFLAVLLWDSPYILWLQMDRRVRVMLTRPQVIAAWGTLPCWVASISLSIAWLRTGAADLYLGSLACLALIRSFETNAYSLGASFRWTFLVPPVLLTLAGMVGLFLSQTWPETFVDWVGIFMLIIVALLASRVKLRNVGLRNHTA